MKKLFGCLILIFAWTASPAQATCTSFPYTLTNGTTADATQAMSNYTYLAGCAAPIASPIFTGNVGIGTTPAYTLDVAGFINTNQASGYKQNGNTVLYANSTINSLAVGASGAAGWMSAASSVFDDVAIGSYALYATPTSGALGNTAIGFEALASDTSGPYNVALGDQTLVDNTSGASNMAIGTGSLALNTTGNFNTGIGTNTLQDNTGSNYNVAIGTNAAFGAGGTYSNQGGTYIGFQAGLYAGTNSNYNTLIGYQSGYNITTGSTNIELGDYQTTSHANITTGSNIIIIGNDIQAPSATGNNQLNIGNLIFGTGVSGTGTTIAGNVGIGTTSPAQTLEVNGEVQVDTFASASSTAVCENAGVLSSCSSSIRYKENVKDAPFGLNEVLQMRPVTFKWKGRDENDLGLIAEEVAKINPLFVTSKGGKIEGVKYAQLTAVLVNAIKELKSANDNQAVQIAQLQTQVSALERKTGLRTAANSDPLRRVAYTTTQR